ncbi:MAG: glycosyltransferase family 2 protein [Planctomycetota bacterium]|nr:glycosyltransferase family 2 protein [Planctomycetota bacterium]
MNHELAIVIISFNTRELTLACLRSIFEQTAPGSFRVVVYDNASSDGSADAIAAEFGRRVDLTRSDVNHGFAKANNLVVATLGEEWVLLLNPDTLIYDRAIDRLLEFAKSTPRYAIFGGRTVFPDGSLNIASCWGRITPWSLFCRASGLAAALHTSEIFNPEGMGAWKRDSVREVDIVVGCFLLIRREHWNALGGFDASFWMYGEEADLCLRARRLGLRAVIQPQATIMHLVGASFGNRADKMMLVAKAKSTLVRRHWSVPARWWGLLMLWLWAFGRRTITGLLGVLGVPGFDRRAAVWREIWGRRRDWLAGYPHG